MSDGCCGSPFRRGTAAGQRFLLCQCLPAVLQGWTRCAASGNERPRVSRHPPVTRLGFAPVLCSLTARLPPRKHSSRRERVTPMSLFIFTTENICTVAEFDF